jgi:hypothetical protein
MVEVIEVLIIVVVTTLSVLSPLLFIRVRTTEAPSGISGKTLLCHSVLVRQRLKVMA